MTTRKNNTVNAALVVAQPVNVAAPEYSRADMVARLASANAEQRITLLRSIPMGEVAAIGGRVAGISQSVNEVLSMKMAEKHGSDWAQLLKMVRSDLCDTDKQRRKDIDASLESIRETIKSNTGGDDLKAADTLRRVKEWGLGIRKSKSAPNANKKQAIDVWAKSWEQFPSDYRRIKNDDMEDVSLEVSDALLGVADAMAAFFAVVGVSPRAVLECKGQSEWNK
jgi:hypothetical protein